MKPCLPIAVLLLLATVAPGAVDQSPAPAAGDIAVLTRWLTGEFDNFQQHYEAKDTKAAVQYDRVHTVITPLSAPSLGAHVLLVRESALNEPDRIAGLHVYVLEPAPGPGGDVRLRIYAVTDPAVLAGILADPTKPVALAPAQLTPVPNDTLTWRRDGDAFVGSGSASGSDLAPRVTRAYRLTADELSFAEGVTDAAGKLVSGRAGADPFKLKRARQFSCYVALLKDGTTDQYHSMLNVLVHDQGKWVTIADDTGRPTKYAFELSQLRYSQQTPVMKLALYQAGKDQAFAYSWADTTGVRIGINLRWIQVGCRPK